MLGLLVFVVYLINLWFRFQVTTRLFFITRLRCWSLTSTLFLFQEFFPFRNKVRSYISNIIAMFSVSIYSPSNSSCLDSKRQKENINLLLTECKGHSSMDQTSRYKKWLRPKLFIIIKCSSYCEHFDWSVWVHYSSIKHSAYVTHYNSTYACKLRHKNFALDKIWESASLPLWLKNFHGVNSVLSLEKCEKHSAAPCASLCTSLVFLKIPACLYNSTMHSGAFIKA